jgi:hypothetical protein
MEQCNPPDPRRIQLNTVVRYAVERRIASSQPDYWDYATLLELAVLSQEKDLANTSLSNAMSVLREPWEAATTARNLSFLRDLQQARGDQVQWQNKVINELNMAMKQ